MQMIKAVVRLEMAEKTVNALDKAGHVALTKLDVIGRGKQKGIQLENIYYDEIPKKMLLLAVDNDEVDSVVDVITEAAFTGNYGDGKIFVSPLDEVYTIRTRSKGL